jgi:NAD(P)-dependent dehydrogenase (short-subunit alcohol dehydrogenase family)
MMHAQTPGRDPRGHNQERKRTMNLQGKTVLITGANRGIGSALIDEVLRHGAVKVYAGTRGPLARTDSRVVPLTLDVTDARQVKEAAAGIDHLDVLFNNAGVAIFDDLSDSEVIERHLAVNFLGAYRVTHAFLDRLREAKGAIVNTLSLAALAPLPMIPAYSMSKAAALSLTQSLRALLAGQGVSVHAVFLGPVDTDMTRGFEIPKSSPAAAAHGIVEGFERGDEDIFPDPASEPMADGWRSGVVKNLERQFAAFAQAAAAPVQ